MHEPDDVDHADDDDDEDGEGSDEVADEDGGGDEDAEGGKAKIAEKLTSNHLVGLPALMPKVKLLKKIKI